MQANDITFFQRFQEDILAGRKTITIRDAAESHFKPGDVLRVGRYEDDGYFCTIAVTATSTVTLDTLTEEHARQEDVRGEEAAARGLVHAVAPADAFSDIFELAHKSPPLTADARS